MRLLLAALALTFAASSVRAQATPSDADVAVYDAGYQTARRLIEQSSSLTFARYQEGFRAGLQGDSSGIAYAIGLQAGLGLHADRLSDADPESFLRGVEAGFTGATPAYNAETVARATSAFQDSVTVRQLREQAATNPQAQAYLEQIRTNAVTAEQTLAAAAARPGATVSPSGLVSVVTTPGTGASPQPGQRLSVTYVGRFADGTVFDQSPEGQPAEFTLDGVVPGFAEALSAMKVGETRTVVMPPRLAYGLRGQGGRGGQGGIPPNSALEFDLTLVAILP